MNAKRILEVEVARAMRNHFQRYYAYTIRKLVQELVWQMLSVREETLNSALTKPGCTNLRLWTTRGVPATYAGVRRLIDAQHQWSLDECSDIIRLFGELAEHLPAWTAHNRGKSKMRPWPTFEQPQKAKDKFGHRHRDELPENQRARRGSPYINIGALWRGVERYVFLPHSVISAIDKTFGLKPEGGDVSGTTTDSIYAMRWAGAVAGVSSGTMSALQLLPMVTMVPQGHHTLLECAYPLSRFGYIDYHIGYYRSLVPMDTSDTIRSDLGRTLGPYEDDVRNKRILVWGRGAQKRGVWMETKAEIDAFRKMTRVLSAYGWCSTGGLTNSKNALNVITIYAPSLEGEFKRQAARL
jgi:hypothetical protein